ncbi:signal peptidase I [Buchnera aphidicola (Taiwanaphis decaspermi)]|uniref:signal peptidase I n=1 Tax=Buchnera aphidicola TaxID=9 RepID=UPI0031B828A2
MEYIFTIVLMILTILSGLSYFLKKIFFYTNKNNDFLNKNFFIKYMPSFFPIFFVIFFIRSFLYEPFRIPSGSMNPTLYDGDYIMVNKFIWGIKNPINNNIIFKVSNPNRGDVVVFRYPHNHNINYIKRIIGIPGDKVIYNELNKELIILSKNNEMINIVYSKNIKNKNFLDKNSEIKHEKIENNEHNILLNSSIKINNHDIKNKNKIFKVWNIPSECYFVMGDSRDNSYDSRYWGFVSKKEIIGKAVCIWMHIKKNSYNFPIRIIFNRVGKIN